MAILLVEYSKIYRTMLKHLLERVLGCDVCDAGGPEAAEMYFDSGITLVISKVHFPDRIGNRDYDGAAAFLRAVRKRISPDVPIIALTTNPVDDKTTAEMVQRYGFPEDMELFDVFSMRPRLLVEEAARLLKVQLPETAVSFMG